MSSDHGRRKGERMMKPGSIPFSIDDEEGATDRAREFCKTRGLTTAQARIVRRRGQIQVEVKIKCALKIKS